MTVEFQLNGQSFIALNGGPHFTFNEAVSFEIPYAGGRMTAVRFEGEASLGPKNRIAVALRTSERRPLGISVTFTRELVKDASLFLRLRKDAEERSLLGGVQVRF